MHTALHTQGKVNDATPRPRPRPYLSPSPHCAPPGARARAPDPTGHQRRVRPIPLAGCLAWLVVVTVGLLPSYEARFTDSMSPRVAQSSSSSSKPPT
jgi:hypothetical protein